MLLWKQACVYMVLVKLVEYWKAKLHEQMCIEWLIISMEFFWDRCNRPYWDAGLSFLSLQLKPFENDNVNSLSENT